MRPAPKVRSLRSVARPPPCGRFIKRSSGVRKGCLPTGRDSTFATGGNSVDDLLNQRQLRLQPVHVFLLAFEDIFEQPPADSRRIAIATASCRTGNAVSSSCRSQFSASGASSPISSFRVAGDSASPQEKDAIDQLIGMLHLVERLVVFILSSFLRPQLRNIRVQSTD
jgi:hypothetical protein